MTDEDRLNVLQNLYDLALTLQEYAEAGVFQMLLRGHEYEIEVQRRNRETL